MEDQGNRITPTSLSISSLLNNPNAPQGYQSRPSTRDIPLVHLTPVPTASLADFSHYIGAVGTEYDNYIRAKQYSLQQHLQQSNTLRPRVKAGSIFSGTDLNEIRLAEQIPASVTASSRVSFDDASSVFSGHNDSPSSEINGFSFGEVGRLQIPAIFAEDDFELKNPRTFDLVTGNSNIVAPISTSETRSHSSAGLHLHEKLSNFMDTVESTLVEEISATSPAFFEALDDLRELQARANSCIERIDLLRSEFARLSADSADVRLETARKVQKKNNTRKLRQSVDLLRRLSELYHAAEEASQESPQACVAAIKAFDAFLQAETSLSKLQIVEEMQYNISKMKHSMGQADIVTFKKLLLDDLTDHTQAAEPQAFIEQLCLRYLKDPRNLTAERKSTLNNAENTDALRASLERTLESLVFTDQLQTALGEYKEAAIREAKLITKRRLPTNDDDDTQSNVSGRTNRTAADKSSALAKALRDMSATDFIDMLRDIYAKTCIYIRQLSIHQKLLIDLVSSRTQSIPVDVQDSIYSSNLSLTVVEICQNRNVKVLNVRSAVNAEMSFADLRRFHDVNRVFNAECEAITGQYGSNLQNALVGQIKAAYIRNADIATQSLTTAIEMDSWQPATLGMRVQDTIDALLDSTTHNPSKWHDVLLSYQITPDLLSGDSKTVMLQDTKYVLPSSAAVLLASVEQFLSITLILPSLRVEAINNTIEVLRIYNSRSCQLILGAGATRSAGLERITAKHLAVTSQALAIVIVLLPSIRAFIGRQNPSPTSLTELDKLYKLYSDHRSEIHSKLISIMEDRTVQICKQLAEWIASNPDVEITGEPNAYMASLVKDTLVLARVLTKFLETEALKMILKRVIDIEETKLAEEYKKAPAEGKIKQQIDIDRAHFVEKISATMPEAGKILAVQQEA